jgi:DNA-binding NarL/FixJ family response regulator
VTARATVILADDHPLVCNGIKTMLEPQYEVLAMVHDGHDLLGTVTHFHPDLVLMDLSLPGHNGLVLTRLLQELDAPPKVMVVTMHAERVYVDEALRAGAVGFVLKTAKASELRQAVSEVLAGRQYITPGLRQTRAPEEELDPSMPLEGELSQVGELTDRQREVLLLVGQGYSNQDIAQQLGISVKAIEYHRAGIRQALAISSQAALYRMAIRYAEKVEGR